MYFIIKKYIICKKLKKKKIQLLFVTSFRNEWKDKQACTLANSCLHVNGTFSLFNHTLMMMHTTIEIYSWWCFSFFLSSRFASTSSFLSCECMFTMAAMANTLWRACVYVNESEISNKITNTRTCTHTHGIRVIFRRKEYSLYFAASCVYLYVCVHRRLRCCSNGFTHRV